jgi:hypothetical protein
MSLLAEEFEAVSDPLQGTMNFVDGDEVRLILTFIWQAPGVDLA